MPPNPDPIFFLRRARPSPAACVVLRAASFIRAWRGLQPCVLFTVRGRPARRREAFSRMSSSRCGFPACSSSGRGLSVACFPAPPSSRTASAQLFFRCSCNQVVVAPSSWLVLWSVSGAEAAVIFFSSLRPLERCSRGNCVLIITSHYLSPCNRLVPLLSILFLMVRIIVSGHFV
jgi:hypothetical protein